MTTMMLRGLDDAISGALKEKARREDTSVNTVLRGFSRNPWVWRRRNEMSFTTIWTT